MNVYKYHKYIVNHYDTVNFHHHHLQIAVKLKITLITVIFLMVKKSSNTGVFFTLNHYIYYNIINKITILFCIIHIIMIIINKLK